MCCFLSRIIYWYSFAVPLCLLSLMHRALDRFNDMSQLMIRFLLFGIIAIIGW